MFCNKKIIFFFLFILILSGLLHAAEKRTIGILPFENLTNQSKHDWIGFGMQYLLFNKLSNVASFYVPDQNFIRKSLADAGYNNGKINGEMVYHVGKSTGINIGITGSYSTNGSNLTMNVTFYNAFNGASIFSKEYRNSMDDIFTIADDISTQILNVAAVVLSGKEQNIVYRRITTSASAFENFCLGYLENEKKNKHLEVIVGLFKKAIQADAKFWEAYYNLGITYFNNRDYDNALRQFDIIIQSLPNFEKPYFGRGLIYMRREEYQKAKADFLRVIEFNPNDYKPFLYLGQISVKLNQFNEAQKYLSKAAELNPDYGPIYFEMGNIYFIQKNYRLAISPYKKAIELDPENYECRQRLGESFYRIQTYYSAYTEFKKILEVHPDDPEANFMIGITAYKQAVLGELIEAFLEMFDPDLAASRRQKGNTQGSEVDRQAVYKEMADAFLRAHNARKNFVEATFNLALTYHEMGDFDNALVYYKEAIAMKPDLIRAHVKLAKLYEDRKEKELALEEYKNIVFVDPSYFVVHPTLGPLHNYINILDLVLNELDEKLKANPNDLDATTALAKIYYAQGFHGKAANLYRKILSINPNDSEAKKMLAQLERR